MKKKRVLEHIISINKLEGLYKACNGRLSHFIFLDDEPQDYIDQLIHEDYIKHVKNTENKKMFVCTDKLIKLFRPLEDYEEVQIDFINKSTLNDNELTTNNDE